MSNRFINDHSVKRVQISKILRITAGGFHSWCESNVGMVRKPNNVILEANENALSEDIIDEFWQKTEKVLEPKWYQRLWNWIKSLFKR